MQKKIFFIILVYSFTNMFFSQESTINDHHVSLTINETMLNNFLLSIGQVKGKGSKKVLGKKINYNWEVTEPKIRIEPGKALFSANILIRSGKVKSTSKSESELDVNYSYEENIIKISFNEIKTDLGLKLFGKKIKLVTIDLSKYYKPSFEFSGPEINQKSIVINKPDGAEITLDIGIHNQNLVLEKEKIMMYSNVSFNQK